MCHAISRSPLNVVQDFTTPAPHAYYGLTLETDHAHTYIVNTALTSMNITDWTRMVVLSWGASGVLPPNGRQLGVKKVEFDAK